jgi:hypothetical protein
MRGAQQRALLVGGLEVDAALEFNAYSTEELQARKKILARKKREI